MNFFYISKTTYEANGKEFSSVNSTLKYGKIPADYSDTTVDFKTFLSWAEQGDFEVSSRFWSGKKFVTVGEEKIGERNFKGAVKKVTFRKVEVNLTFKALMDILPHRQFMAYLKDTLKPQNYLKG